MQSNAKHIRFRLAVALSYNMNEINKPLKVAQIPNGIFC